MAATFSSKLPSNKAMLADGQTVDLSNAYRRLSDANLAFSSGSLASLPMRKRSDDAGEGRLVKDYLGPDGEHLESSDEEEEPYSSDDEDRGRKTAPRSLNPRARGDSGDSKSRSPAGPGKRKSLSLLAAAEAERKEVSSQLPAYQYRSLIPEPEIKITNTSGDTVKQSKGGIHPQTSYDPGLASGAPSMIDSDEEADVDDIKRAQKLSFSMTNVMTSPEAHRSIRIIYRGEYNKVVQQAEEENHRLRKYLVATDLSDESTHALEWAIGTVLRDGDTLIAIYCVDEETGIVTGEGSLVPDEPTAMKEQAAAINSVTNSKTAPAPVSPLRELHRASPLHMRTGSGDTPSASPAPSARGDRGDRRRAEEERSHAITDMTNRVVRLLRKTRLQVRVIVEVLHCKNPRHLITEVIDLVNPTLVVIGSRGRSALKGVILGSFSNYLVTKSSVPVMVARKRLRKTKYKQKAAKQVNNLSPTARSVANAKVD
ncbi:universal stress protein [Purpureocillium lavendulum]|uniref:Universal stress protein n=1 Tax=Purpureocillium lavendulum TaxID=1247861 RepID=A0AB34FSG3_9HYPO|nr:universal stress protein [Purpureocillium lavendulum]